MFQVIKAIIITTETVLFIQLYSFMTWDCTSEGTRLSLMQAQGLSHYPIPDTYLYIQLMVLALQYTIAPLAQTCVSLLASLSLCRVSSFLFLSRVSPLALAYEM